MIYDLLAPFTRPDTSYPRKATSTHDTWGLPFSRPEPAPRPDVTYRLPDGRSISLPWDLCKGALFMGYQMDGRVVQARRED